MAATVIAAAAASASSQSGAAGNTNTSTNSDLDANRNGNDLKAAIFQRLHPRVYLERFIAEGVRPDGRALDFGSYLENTGKADEPWRNVSINVGHAQGSISTAAGSALVRMGGTTIVCGVKAEIAEPDLEKPNEGFIVPNVDLPAMCHPRFKPGPPSDEAQVLSERVHELLSSTTFIPLQSLVIAPGKAVWTLYVDATCINYDGNTFDAALLAIIAALMNTRLPRAVYDEDTGRTLCYRKESSSLCLKQLPIPVSFGIFDSTHVLTDPTAFEEPLVDSVISVVVNEQGELLNIMQQGLGAIYATLPSDPILNDAGTADAVLHSCIEAAGRRGIELGKMVKEVVGQV